MAFIKKKPIKRKNANKQVKFNPVIKSVLEQVRGLSEELRNEIIAEYVSLKIGHIKKEAEIEG